MMWHRIIFVIIGILLLVSLLFDFYLSMLWDDKNNFFSSFNPSLVRLFRINWLVSLGLLLVLIICLFLFN